MTTRLNLLNHLVKLLSHQGIFFEVDSETATKMLGVSLKTLIKARKTGKLPYTRHFRGVLVVVNFVETHEGRDWQVHLKAMEDSKLDENKTITSY
jgi:hypothetical protein